jgi:hypothetical protein
MQCNLKYDVRSRQYVVQCTLMAERSFISVQYVKVQGLVSTETDTVSSYKHQNP